MKKSRRPPRQPAPATEITDPILAMTDPDEAQRFLALLGKDPATTYFRTIRHGVGANKSRKGRDLLGFDAAALKADNDAGDSIYLVVGNATGASGKNKEGKPTGAVIDTDITSCPALFVEWDHMPKAEQLAAWQELQLPEPTAMLDSGGKSVHCYWRLTDPITPEQWRKATAQLIAHCNSDPSCSNPSRVMRLPGFRYWDKQTGKATGTSAALLSTSDNSYTLQQLLACMPDPQQELTASPAPAAPQARTYAPHTLQEIEAAAQFIPPRVVGQQTYEPSRRALCGCAAALAEIDLPEEQALDLLADRWPDRATAAQVLHSSTTRKSDAFWAIAKENGYRRASSSTANVDQVVDDFPDHGDSSQQQGQQRRSNDLELLTYSQLIRDALNAIRNGSRDREMACRAEIKGRFRCSDAQITKALIEELTRDEAGTSTPCTYGTVDLDRTAGMDWLIEGFIPANDQVLLYGEAGAGKTTAAIGLAFAVIDGTGFLDRASCAPRGSVLFIASDSGADPLRTALQGMGLLDHAALAPDAPHRLFVWAHDAEQGRMAWDASLPGLIALQDFIRENRIQLVLIDSAKAVTSKADLNYCENGPVTALLTFAKESLCRFCSIVWLHHDGTAKGTAAGAKAWKEVPSAVHAIEKYVIEGSGDERNGGGSRGPSYTSDLMRVWTVKKCRLGTHREFKYELDTATGRPVLIPGAAGAVVHDARAAIVEVLTQAWQNGSTSLSRQALASELRQRWSYSGKTTDNNLSRMVSARHPEVCRLSTPRGHYKLAPRVVEVLRAAQLANPSLNTSLLEGKEQGQTPVPDCDLVISREVPSGTQGNSAEFPREKLGNSQPASAGKGSDLVPSHGTFTPRTRARDTPPPPAELLAKLMALRLNNPTWHPHQLAVALDPLGNHGIDEQTVRGWMLDDQPSAA